MDKHRNKSTTKVKPTQREKQKAFNQVRATLRRIAEEQIQKMKDEADEMSEHDMEAARQAFDEISEGRLSDIDEENGEEELPQEDKAESSQEENNDDLAMIRDKNEGQREANKLKILSSLSPQFLEGEAQESEFIVFNGERKWNERLQNPKLGKFEPSEKRLLIKSFVQYVKQNGLSFDHIIDTISRRDGKIPSNSKMWTNVCSVLPNRSLKNSYKYLMRKLSKNNRLKKWSPEEEEQLLSLQNRLGNKWAMIGKQMGRTPDNVRDKFRCIHTKDKEFWKVEELVDFMKQIQDLSGVKFLNPLVDQELPRAEEHNRKEKVAREQMKVRYNSKLSIHHNNIVLLDYIDIDKFNSLDRQKLRWKQISDKIENKTEIDCKNKFFEFMKIVNRDSEGKNALKVVAFIQAQKPQSESDIAWQKWKPAMGFHLNEAKNRWFLLKKKIDGRSEMSFPQIIASASAIANKRREAYLASEQKFKAMAKESWLDIPVNKEIGQRRQKEAGQQNNQEIIQQRNSAAKERKQRSASVRKRSKHGSNK